MNENTLIEANRINKEMEINKVALTFLKNKNSTALLHIINTSLYIDIKQFELELKSEVKNKLTEILESRQLELKEEFDKL